mgnify:FL=1
MKDKIAVISDIHSNADALKVVLSSLSENSVDLTVFLGDLWTYGCQPNEIIDMILTYQSKCRCVFIKGNHDQFYFDIQTGLNFKNYNMPGFVEESIDWTAQRVSSIDLLSLFDWQSDFIFEKVYFSHANPFDYGNWGYLDKIETCQSAFDELAIKSCMVGVFGHSHRQKFIQQIAGNLIEHDSNSVRIGANEKYIINAGSIGQARGYGFCYLLLELDAGYVKADLIPLSFDLTNSIALIENANFSQTTQQKLIDYLRS